MADATISPTKKTAFGPTSAPPVDPTDIRGSLQKQAKTEYDDMIRWRAAQNRAAVSRGPLTQSNTIPNTRRPLGFSRTEPVLSFGSSSQSTTQRSSEFPPFRTAQDINASVFGTATDSRKLPNELRPMWETGSEVSDSSRSNSRVGSGFFGADAAGGGGGMTETSMEDDGDGFDLDEAFGKSSHSFGFLPMGAGAQDDSQGSTRTVTQRLKRAYDSAESAGVQRQEGGGEDDDDMPPTDVEDEGEDQVPAELPGMFGGRKIAGSKRAFGRTQSLPSQAFSGAMEF